MDKTQLEKQYKYFFTDAYNQIFVWGPVGYKIIHCFVVRIKIGVLMNRIKSSLSDIFRLCGNIFKSLKINHSWTTYVEVIENI